MRNRRPRRAGGQQGMEPDAQRRESCRGVILFGPPGSGKGTQAKLLVEAWPVPHISTGEMLRAAIESGDSIGREVSAVVRGGGLVPDALVNLLVERRLAQPDCAAGFVLDGYPRTLEQAKVTMDLFERRGIREVVIHLAVDYNVIIARLAGRRQCASCGALYHVAFHPPQRDGVCDFDGEALYQRDDDTEAVIRQRLAAYEEKTLPILRYLQESGRRWVEVASSTESPQWVQERIRRAVEAA